MKRGPKPHEGLTPKQVEVMELAAKGKTIVEMAMILEAKPMAVKSQYQQAKQKLGAYNKASAVALYVEKKLKSQM